MVRITDNNSSYTPKPSFPSASTPLVRKNTVPEDKAGAKATETPQIEQKDLFATIPSVSKAIEFFTRMQILQNELEDLTRRASDEKTSPQDRGKIMNEIKKIRKEQFIDEMKGTINQLKELRYGQDWDKLISEIETNFEEGIKSGNKEKLGKADKLLARARLYQNAQRTISNLESKFKQVKDIPKNKKTEILGSLRRYASALVKGEGVQAQEHYGEYLKQIREVQKTGKEEQTMAVKDVIGQAEYLLKAKRSERYEVEFAYKELDRLVKLYNKDQNLPLDKVESVKLHSRLISAALILRDYNDQEHAGEISADPELKQAFDRIEDAVMQGRIDDLASRDLAFVSKRLPSLLERTNTRMFQTCMQILEDSLKQVFEDERSGVARLGADVRRLVSERAGGEKLAYNYIKYLLSRDEIYSTFNDDQTRYAYLRQLNELKQKDPKAYNEYLNGKNGPIFKASHLEGIKSAEDLYKSIALVNFLIKNGHIPQNLKTNEGKKAFIESLGKIRKNALVSLSNNLKVGEAFDQYSKFGINLGITIGVTVLSAGIGSITAGSMVTALGSRVALSGFTRHLLTQAISASMFTLASRTLDYALGREEHWFSGGRDFAESSVKNFFMFAATGGVMGAYGRLAGNPISRIGQVFAKTGGFLTEIGAFTAWGLGEQHVTATFRGEKTDGMFTAKNIGKSVLDNAVFVLGLKGGNRIAEPVIGSIRSKIAQKVAKDLSPKIEQLDRREVQFLDKLSKTDPQKLTSAEKYSLSKEKLSIEKERLDLLKRYAALGLAGEKEVKDTEYKIKGLEANEKALKEKLTPEERKVAADGIMTLRKAARAARTTAIREGGFIEVLREQGNDTKGPGLERVGEEAGTGIQTPKGKSNPEFAHDRARLALKVQMGDEGIKTPTPKIKLSVKHVRLKEMTPKEFENYKKEKLDLTSKEAKEYDDYKNELIKKYGQPSNDLPLYKMEAIDRAIECYQENPVVRAGLDVLLFSNLEQKKSISNNRVALGRHLLKMSGELVTTPDIPEKHMEYRDLMAHKISVLAKIRTLNVINVSFRYFMESSNNKELNSYINSKMLLRENKIFSIAVNDGNKIGATNSLPEVVESGQVSTEQIILVDGNIYRIAKGSSGSYFLQQGQMKRVSNGDRIFVPERNSKQVIIPAGTKNESTPIGNNGARLEFVRNNNRDLDFRVIPASQLKVSEHTNVGLAYDKTELAEIGSIEKSDNKIFEVPKTGEGAIEFGGQKFLVMEIMGNYIIAFKPKNSGDALTSITLQEGRSQSIGKFMFSRINGQPLVRAELISQEKQLSNKQIKEELDRKQAGIPLSISNKDAVAETKMSLKIETINNKKQVVININGVIYEEVRDVKELKHGDILPGSNFKIDDPKTWDRELLGINTESGRLAGLIRRAKISAKYHKGSILELAYKISKSMNEKFSTKQDQMIKPGEKITLGYFIEKGGCCRHRSAVLVMLLEAVGIKCRYMRGGLAGGGNHAWVEIDIKGDGSYSYVIDPNMGHSGSKVNEKWESRPGAFSVAGKAVYFPEGEGAVVWRPQSKGLEGKTLTSLSGSLSAIVNPKEITRSAERGEKITRASDLRDRAKVVEYHFSESYQYRMKRQALLDIAGSPGKRSKYNLPTREEIQKMRAEDIEYLYDGLPGNFEVKGYLSKLAKALKDNNNLVYISVPKQYLESIREKGIIPGITWDKQRVIAGMVGAEYLPKNGEERVVITVRVNPEEVIPRFTGQDDDFNGVVLFLQNKIPPERIILPKKVQD